MPGFSLSLSEKYAILAALALLVVVWWNNPVAILAVSIAGLAAGAWVVSRGDARRVAVVALVAFAVSLVFAIIMLLR